jgi:hypothetical protein
VEVITILKLHDRIFHPGASKLALHMARVLSVGVGNDYRLLFVGMKGGVVHLDCAIERAVHE